METFMANTRRSFVIKALASASPLALLVPGPVAAQVLEPQGEETQVARSDAAESQAADNEAIIVTGSRFGGRIATDSPTPIDAISSAQLERGGGADLQSTLKVAVPSFSTPRPAAAGASDFLQSPTMRGLSTGQILVLVNNKRRHTNSDLNTNQQIGRGDVAYDFSAIPTFAVKTVEVLRDGAAAQYGSDAIGGVLNIILNDQTGFTGSGRVGMTTEEDGQHNELNAGFGLPVGDGGVVRITGQYIDHSQTDRALPDTRQQYFGRTATGALVLPSGNFGSGIGLTPSNGTLDPREAGFNRDIWVFGEPDYESKALFVNAKLPLGSVQLYSFGGYSHLDGISHNFFRRAGQDETVRALHPDGFLPLNNVVLENLSGAVGVRGDAAGIGWDLSTAYGTNSTRQSNLNTNNVSMGLNSPRNFFRSESQFSQWTTNLDLSTEIQVGDAAPLKLAAGLEYRKEWYDLLPGDPSSYLNGGIPILDGPNAGRPAPIGSQPVPGVEPANATSGSRNAKAAYAEIEKLFFGRLLLNGAVRFEDYSDFGSTTNFKIASRFEVSEALAFRGSYGTGFRAPALPQIFFNSSQTSFVNGQPVSIRLVSVRDPMADLIGAPDLMPEKAKNLSVGAVFTSGGLTASVDFYQIKLRDRLALSSIFQSAPLTNFLANRGFPGISSVSFVTNGVNTTTRGFDVTASWRRRFSADDLVTATFAANFNDNEIDSFLGTPAPLAALGITTPLLDLTQQIRLTKSAPKDKIALDLNWEHGGLGANFRLTRYGEVSHVALTNRTPAQVQALTPGFDVTLVPVSAGSPNQNIIQHFSADVIADLELSYDVGENFNIAVGASNLFDKYPDRQIASTAATVAAGTNGADNNGIFPYAFIAPYGFSGRFVYLRVKFSL
jgi:iron complex outermembrane receptor protein